MNKKENKKVFYFFIGCMLLSVIIIGATFAYFTASTSDDNTVHGGTYLTSFSLSVTRVTTVDMAYGLIPMKDSESPNAAEQKCLDDFGNAGCQIYKITVGTDSQDPIFVDGYIVLTNKEGVETKFTRVYPKKVTNEETNEETTIFTVNYTQEDFNDENFEPDEVIKDGQLINQEEEEEGTSINHIENMNRNDNYNCLLAQNEQIGADKPTIEIYAMIWVHDNGNKQDSIQGMQLAYTGLAVFNTAQGNEIKATFD